VDEIIESQSILDVDIPGCVIYVPFLEGSLRISPRLVGSYHLGCHIGKLVGRVVFVVLVVGSRN
jgi:hypothetical protein